MYESFPEYNEDNLQCNKYLYCGTLIMGLFIGFCLRYECFYIPPNDCNLTV